MVLGGRVRVHHLQPTVARVQPGVQSTGPSGQRIALRLVSEGKEVGHGVGTVLRILAEALVELPSHAAHDIRDDPVERVLPVLVDVEVVVDESAQQPAGLVCERP